MWRICNVYNELVFGQCVYYFGYCGQCRDRRIYVHIRHIQHQHGQSFVRRHGRCLLSNKYLHYSISYWPTYTTAFITAVASPELPA